VIESYLEVLQIFKFCILGFKGNDDQWYEWQVKFAAQSGSMWIRRELFTTPADLVLWQNYENSTSRKGNKLPLLASTLVPQLPPPTPLLTLPIPSSTRLHCHSPSPSSPSSPSLSFSPSVLHSSNRNKTTTSEKGIKCVALSGPKHKKSKKSKN
jgi:hypothetical protein